MANPRPKKGSKVKLRIKTYAKYKSDHIFVVAENHQGKKFPYKLDDGVESNPVLIGPFSSDELILVEH